MSKAQEDEGRIDSVELVEPESNFGEQASIETQEIHLGEKVIPGIAPDKCGPVMIGYGWHRGVNGEFPWFYSNWLEFLQRQGFTIARARVNGTYLADGRNSLAMAARRAGVKWLCMVDDDMLAPDNILYRLLTLASSHEIPVLGTNYVSHSQFGPKPVTQIVEGEFASEAQCRIEIAKARKGELSKVYSIGTGITVFNIEALTALNEYSSNETGWFDEYPGIGEDLSFCKRCHKAGLDIYCDFGLPLDVMHAGTYFYSMADYMGYPPMWKRTKQMVPEYLRDLRLRGVLAKD